MRFKNLDLNLLVALDTLIRLRNVSRAADEMFITQSAMSNALGRLRSYFDDPLLIQVGNRMELSPLAASLEAPVRDIIVRIDAAVLTAPSFDPSTAQRKIGLVISDYSLHTIVGPFLSRVASSAPHLTFELKPQQISPHLLLERGEADLLIAPRVFCSPNHPVEFLLSDPLVCVVDADGPFGHVPLTTELFAQASHVVMQPPAGGESYAVRACRDLGFDLRVVVTTFAFSSLPALIAGTDRIAILQSRLARQFADDLRLRLIDPPVKLSPLEQCIQWHSIRSRDPALAWLRMQLKQVGSQLSGAN